MLCDMAFLNISLLGIQAQKAATGGLLLFGRAHMARLLAHC